MKDKTGTKFENLYGRIPIKNRIFDIEEIFLTNNA